MHQMTNNKWTTEHHYKTVCGYRPRQTRARIQTSRNKGINNTSATTTKKVTWKTPIVDKSELLALATERQQKMHTTWFRVSTTKHLKVVWELACASITIQHTKHCLNMLWRVVLWIVVRVGHENNWKRPFNEETMHQPKIIKQQNAFVRKHWKRWNKDQHEC